MARARPMSYVEPGRLPHWRSALWSGVIGGVAFLVLELLLVGLFTPNPIWAPVRMIGAIVMGSGVVPPPATYDGGVLVAALAVHGILSVIYAYALSYLIYHVQKSTAIWIGLGFGLALYLINFFIFTAAFPWFAEARNWITILAHLVFGGASAWSYKLLAAREVMNEQEHQR